MKQLYIFSMMLALNFAFSQPTTNPAEPNRLAENVISVFSDSYTNVATNYNPNWGSQVQ